MVLCFPSTPKKLAVTISCFLSGAAILAVGVHLSYVNVAPQRARTLARDELVRETLRKKYGYIPPLQARSMARDDLVKETLINKNGYIPPQQARSMARNDLVKETLSNFGFKK